MRAAWFILIFLMLNTVAPSAFAAGLEELIFTTNLLGTPTLGLEAAWGFDEHWLMHAGVPFRIESEAQNDALQVWGRGVLLYRFYPLPYLTVYGGLGLTTGISVQDGLTLSPFFELPLGLQTHFWGDLGLLAEVRIGLTDLLSGFDESFRFITLAAGITFALR